MGKLEFFDALKRAMTGLPPEAQARTLAFYEQRFVDGVAAGRSEQDVAREQDDPKRIAMTLRANTHMQAFETKKNPANLVRMLVAALGLAIFNLFMVVPAMVYAAVLAALYAAGLAFYLGGALVAASGLSGANQIDLGVVQGQFVANANLLDNDTDVHTKINISETGIQVDTVHPDKSDTSATAVSVSEGDDDEEHDGSARKSPAAVIKGDVSVARGIRISTDVDDESRTAFGLAMVLGGIVLLLASLVVTRYSLIGLRRYIEMNFSLLRGH